MFAHSEDGVHLVPELLHIAELGPLSVGAPVHIAPLAAAGQGQHAVPDMKQILYFVSNPVQYNIMALLYLSTSKELRIW